MSKVHSSFLPVGILWLEPGAYQRHPKATAKGTYPVPKDTKHTYHVDVHDMLVFFFPLHCLHHLVQPELPRGPVRPIGGAICAFLASTPGRCFQVPTKARDPSFPPLEQNSGLPGAPSITHRNTHTFQAPPHIWAATRTANVSSARPQHLSPPCCPASRRSLQEPRASPSSTYLQTKPGATCQVPPLEDTPGLMRTSSTVRLSAQHVDICPTCAPSILSYNYDVLRL